MRTGSETATDDSVVGRIDRRLQPAIDWLADGRNQRVLLTVGLVAIAVECVLLAVIPPVDSFENSLVGAYPPAFWAAFATALTVAILVFVGATLQYSSNWRYAFALLGVNYGIFFFLPAHRGYAMYGRGTSDALVHLGIVKSILQGSSFPPTFYPIEHLLLSTIAGFGVSLPLARYLFQIGFTVFFIGTVGILTRELIGDRRGLPAGLAAASPLVLTYFHVRIHPAILSVMLFPLAVFAIERMRKTEIVHFRVIGVIVAMVVVFFHPMTTAFFVILVGSSIALQRAYEYYQRRGPDLAGVSRSMRKLRTQLVGLVVVVGFTWYHDFHRTQAALDGLLVEQEPTIIEHQANLAEQGLSIVQIGIRFGQRYGTLTIVLLLGAVFGLLAIRRLQTRESEYASTYVALQAAIGVAIAIGFITMNLLENDPVRVSRYATIMAVVAAGMLLYQLTTYRMTARGQPTAIVVVAVALVLAAALGSFAGLTYWPNKHLTETEYQGAEFTIEYHDSDDVVRSMLSPDIQYYVTGQRSREGEREVFAKVADHDIPPGLGYGGNATARQTFEPEEYVVTHAYDTEYPKASYYFDDQRAFVGVYNERDVQRLDGDSTVSKVYSNGGYTLWKVSPETVAAEPTAASATAQAPGESR